MVKIDGYEIDAAPLEQHAFDSMVTEHAVEDGSDITDHVRTVPVTVTIEGIVTDTPVGPIADTRGATLPSSDAFQRLQTLYHGRSPVVVETDLGAFSDMILQSLSVPIKDGDALRFRAFFKQIIIKTSDRTKSVSIPRAAAKQERGHKPSKEATPDLTDAVLDKLNLQKPSQSILSRLAG